MLNFDLLKNPFNWFTVLFMLVIASIAFHLLGKLFGGTTQQSPIPAAFTNTDGN
jgi:hypothetical protein